MNQTRNRTPSRTCQRALPIVTAVLLCTGYANAEVVVQEDSYRDWIGRCETETTTGEVVCFIYTGRVAEFEGEELAARLVVGLGDQLQPIVYLDVPDTAEPADGFMLRIDSREPFSGRFIDCSNGWCHTEAGGEIGEELVAQFRAGSTATASFIVEERQAQFDMPLSLLGFTAAYEQLVAIHQRALEAAALDQTETADDQDDGDAAEDDADEQDATEQDATGQDASGPDAADAPTDQSESGDVAPTPDNATDDGSSEDPAGQ